MKTRTLLLLAVACGLVILVAGSIKLFLLAEDERPQPLLLGQQGRAGDMTVTAFEPVRQVGSTLLIDVELQGVDDPDGASPFWLIRNGARFDPQSPPDGAGATCAATLSAGPTRCVLAFDTTDPQGVLLYERSGDVVRWEIIAN